MQTESTTCYRCGGKMEQGYLAGKTCFWTSFIYWVAGRFPTPGYDRSKQKSIVVYRCENCGTLEHRAP